MVTPQPRSPDPHNPVGPCVAATHGRAESALTWTNQKRSKFDLTPHPLFFPIVHVAHFLYLFKYGVPISIQSYRSMQ